MSLNSIELDPLLSTIHDRFEGRVRTIIKMGHPTLLKVAASVQNPASEETHQIVADMLATLKDIGTFAGLAAPQINIPKRIALFRVPHDAYHVNRYQLKHTDYPVPLTAMINPSYKPIESDKTTMGWEGCLSVPGLIGEVERYEIIEYSYFDLNGERIIDTASGFKARVIQHEIDHLDGMLFVHKVKNKSRLGYREEMLEHVVQGSDYLDE